MVSGLSLTAVEASLQRTGSTKTKHLVAWLRARGWECPDRLQPFKGRVDRVSIVKLARRRPDGRLDANWHWVVLSPSGEVLDPQQPAGKLSEGILMSYLPITTSRATRSRSDPA